ncbi:hypothetical protein E2C01_080826 [Portunus trituberculatus]|uniref:Uncharacterized protein n=1 Tax=Portunus trituberculatus TaxID=210409 RepID=A0A5B7J0M3_PORTR|nr:hypothetical protein [Portunus trituberculatus]
MDKLSRRPFITGILPSYQRPSLSLPARSPLLPVFIAARGSCSLLMRAPKAALSRTRLVLPSCPCSQVTKSRGTTTCRQPHQSRLATICLSFALSRAATRPSFSPALAKRLSSSSPSAPSSPDLDPWPALSSQGHRAVEPPPIQEALTPKVLRSVADVTSAAWTHCILGLDSAHQTSTVQLLSPTTN